MTAIERQDTVFLVPVPDCQLVVAPLHQTCALVNDAAAREIRAGFVPSGPEWTEFTEALASPAMEEPVPPIGELPGRMLGLIPTRSCNLRCGYCGFGAGNACDGEMTPETAVAAINWMAGQVAARGENTINVHFFGGEPMLNADAVDTAVHRTRAVAAASGLTPRLETATNGVFDERLARFLGDHFDVVALSFDGFRDDHNRQRPRAGGEGSFAAVKRTAEILSLSPCDLSIRLCVTSENVERLPETVAWFAEEFQPAGVDVETLQRSPESERNGLQPPDPRLFARRFLEARRAAAALGVNALYAAALHDRPRHTFCPLGTDAVIVAPDGRLSGCYLLREDWQARGLDLDFGYIGPWGEISIDAGSTARARNAARLQPRCTECFCRYWCAGGCHVNHSYPGCPEEFDEFCEQTRLITAAEILEEVGSRDLAERMLELDPARKQLQGA